MASTDTDLAPEAGGDSAVEEKPKLSLEVKVDEPSTCQRHITVTVSRDDIERYYKDAFDELVPKAEVPGFRPGRAPRKLVESKFREQMTDQVKGSLLMDSVSQVNEDQDFSAISEPDFDFEAIEMPDEGPLTFEFDIEVRPEFDVPDWKGLKLEKPVHEYTDQEVDDHLQTLLARYGELVDKDGTVAAGDRVTLNITFKKGDDVLSQIEGETVEVKSTLSFRDANLDNFDKKVKDLEVGGTKKAKVKVSDEADAEELRGKQIDAEIEVTGIQTMKVPDLTPTFLDKIGGFEDEEDLREAVREELDRQHTYYQQRRIREQITGVLTKDAKWDLPPDLLKRQQQREVQRAILELRSSGFNDDVIRAYQNQLLQNSAASTERALKEHFILERIAEEHDVEAEDYDYDVEVKMIARQSDESPRRVRARLEKRGQMDSLRNQIIERKVIDLITAEAEFTEKDFEPDKDETVAIDHAITGHEEEADIPEAKYGGEAEQLRTPGDRS